MSIIPLFFFPLSELGRNFITAGIELMMGCVRVENNFEFNYWTMTNETLGIFKVLLTDFINNNAALFHE